jgi:hypothetical protein
MQPWPQLWAPNSTSSLCSYLSERVQVFIHKREDKITVSCFTFFLTSTDILTIFIITLFYFYHSKIGNVWYTYIKVR